MQIRPEEARERALQVVTNLSGYKPREFPDRPELLHYDDAQIVEAYKARHRGEKVSAAAREQLRYFGQWRSAIWTVEEQHAGNLVLLASVVRALEANERPDEAKGVRSFLREHYHCSLPDQVPALDKWVYGFGTRFGENRRLLPLWLRKMSRPPAGAGTRQSGHTGSDGDVQPYLNYGPDAETGEWAE